MLGRGGVLFSDGNLHLKNCWISVWMDTMSENSKQVLQCSRHYAKYALFLQECSYFQSVLGYVEENSRNDA